MSFACFCQWNLKRRVGVSLTGLTVSALEALGTVTLVGVFCGDANAVVLTRPG